MATFAGRFGPDSPDATYVAHTYPEQLFDTGEVHLNYATLGASRPASLVVDPRPDRVVVGLRGRDAPPCRSLLRLRRRSPRPGTLDAHPGALHPRQHGPRSGALHRRCHRSTHTRQRAVVGRGPLRLAVRLREAWAGRRLPLRGPPSVRLRDRHQLWAFHPPGNRADVRVVEQVPGGSVVRRRLGRDARGRAERAPRLARLAGRPAGADRNLPRTSRNTTPNGGGPSGPARSAPAVATTACCRQ